MSVKQSKEQVVATVFVLFLLFLEDSRRKGFVNWLIDLCGISRAMLFNSVFRNFHM